MLLIVPFCTDAVPALHPGTPLSTGQLWAGCEQEMAEQPLLLHCSSALTKPIACIVPPRKQPACLYGSFVLQLSQKTVSPC